MQNSQRTNRKKAPSANLYTRSEAIQKLGLPKSTFHDYVTAGRIQKVVPPGKREGYYLKKEIDDLADATHLFILQYTSEPTTFSLAKEEDIEGIYYVVESLWGKNATTPIELRKSWYKVNPLIDYVVKKQDIVVGYLSVTPLSEEALKLTREGRKREWNLEAKEILTFEPGNSYNCYIVLAVRQDVPNSKIYAMRLILGFYHILTDFASRGVKIRSLHATSHRPEGIKLCEDLGFDKESPVEGSVLNRYHLNLESSNVPFAQKYRESLKHLNHTDTLKS